MKLIFSGYETAKDENQNQAWANILKNVAEKGRKPGFL
jgi:hypothetical protein